MYLFDCYGGASDPVCVNRLCYGRSGGLSSTLACDRSGQGGAIMGVGMLFASSLRSEERRVGKEGRARWSRGH